MMSSEILYRDQCLVLPDHRLAIMIGIFIRCTEQMEMSASRNAVRWRDAWQNQLRNRIPGLLDLRLPDLLEGPADITDFKLLLSLAKNEVEQFGEFVSPSELARIASCGIGFAKRISTSMLQADLASVEKLIRQ